MKNKFAIKLALKSILGRKMRSLITIGGVTIGIAAIIFLVSLGYGLQKLVINQITTMEALRVIDIFPEKSTVVKLNDESIAKLKNLSHVEDANQLINIAGKIGFGGSVTDTVVYGADNEYLRLSNVKVDRGEKFPAEAKNVAIVNQSVLELLGIKDYQNVLSKVVKLRFIPSKGLLAEENKTDFSNDFEYKVIGVIDDRSTPYLYVPLEDLKALGVINYSQSKVKVDSTSQLASVRKQIENLGLKTVSVSDTVAQIEQIFSVFRIVLGSFGIIAMIVASLGMFNTLTVSLMERTREVGIMKVLGAKKKDVRKVFLAEALILGFTGGISGALVGFIFSNMVNFGLNLLAASSGYDKVDVFYTPPELIGLVVAIALFVGIVTGIYPARRAVKINPLDALRYE
ncbi:MAG: ABC transporter permease [Patescibacteria group bacterium]|nr:ABC transporter permease [Patescibacteria group bacterium]